MFGKTPWPKSIKLINKKTFPQPSYGIIDAQSVKAQLTSQERGFDGAKKVQGRKRHIVVVILGNLLHVSVLAANLSETKESCQVLARALENKPSCSNYTVTIIYQAIYDDHATFTNCTKN